MKPLASAEVIAVGSEMLGPDRLDTNSLAIADRLRALGIPLRAKAVVGDRPDDLAAILRGALARSDLIVLIGGLGPTDDDVTRDVVASSLELPLSEDVAISDAIRQRFRAARHDDAGDQPAAGDGAARRRGAAECQRHRARAVTSNPATRSSCCCPGRRAS